MGRTDPRQRDEQRRSELEDDVLVKADRLDPADNSARARQLRETAASIRDHRSSPR